MSRKIQGTVVSVNEAGDLITDIAVERLADAPTDDQVTITCDGHSTSCLFSQNHSQPKLTFVAVLGDSGRLELSLVGENASAFLGIRPGANVTVKW